MQTILIIEDEESLRLTLADRLTMEGFRARTAADGKQGLVLAHEDPPDLILCDIMMPEMDGYAVFNALQADPSLASIPFIFLTAKSDPSQVRKGMALGADDYLCKPVAKADLLAAISTRLERKRQQHHHLELEVEAARQDVVRKLPHELLTPLTGLLNASQLLEAADPSLPIATIRELGQAIRLASQRLHRSIRRILLYAEQTSARGNPQAQAGLRGTAFVGAKSLVSTLAEHIAKKDARLEDLQLDLTDIEVRMDATHFGEMVSELVENAFKFSVPGSVVRIQLGLSPDGGCVLEVRDQGRGMTAEQVAQVGAFRQFDSERWAQPGFGLGLTLVKQVAALYGGSLRLQSEPGNGSRATLRLPEARARVQNSGSADPSLVRKVTWELGDP